MNTDSPGLIALSDRTGFFVEEEADLDMGVRVYEGVYTCCLAEVYGFINL